MCVRDERTVIRTNVYCGDIVHYQKHFCIVVISWIGTLPYYFLFCSVANSILFYVWVTQKTYVIYKQNALTF